MLKTVIINGSPKGKNSASNMFIDKIKEFLDKEPRIYQANKLLEGENDFKELSTILNADVLLFVFPLYVDSLPAPLIKVLNMIEKEASKMNGKFPTVYAISNCGFYEAEQNRLALDIVKNFSYALGMSWMYGIGIGNGGYVASRSKNISKKGSASNVYYALCELGEAMKSHDKTIKSNHVKQNVFVTPKMSRFVYKLSGNLGWYLMAMKHSSLTSLKAKPHVFKK